MIFGQVREVVIAVTKRFWKRFAEPIPLQIGGTAETFELARADFEAAWKE